MEELAISTHDLTRDFGAVRAVDGLTLGVPRGTLFGFLGPNGSGKTTTIRLLLGLLEPTRGHAEVLGLDTRTRPDQIRQLAGALLEHTGLYQRLSAEDNLEFCARIATAVCGVCLQRTLRRGEARMLTLADELLLLALRDEQGTVAGGASLALGFGLSGALLAELILLGKLRLAEKGRVEVADPSPTGDALLDEALAAVAQRARPRSLRDWVLDLGQGKLKRLKERLAERLVAQGILREQEGRFLWVFATHRYPELDSAAERGIRERVRAVVLGGSPPDERVLILLSLIKACRLVDEVFARDERKAARRRLDELTKAEAAGAAVSKAVAEIESATMAAVAASMSSSTAASTSG